MGRCKQELCPMWDGDTCPCATFGFDPDNPPTDGTFIVRTTPYASSTRPWWADPEEGPDD